MYMYVLIAYTCMNFMYMNTERLCGEGGGTILQYLAT